MCYFSKLEHIAHYNVKNKEWKHSQNKSTHMHACMHQVYGIKGQ